MVITNVVDGLWCPGQSCSSASRFGLVNRCDSNRCEGVKYLVSAGCFVQNFGCFSAKHAN